MRKIAMIISGGATKIPFLAGVALSLIINKKVRPSFFIGISSGAILSFTLGIGKYNDTFKNVINFSLSSFMANDMSGFKGFMKTLYNVLRGKHHLNSQKPLKKLLMNVVTEDDFELWKGDVQKPEIFVGAVSLETGKRIYKDLRDCDYEEAIDWVMASASIPFYTEGSQIDGENWFDGGLRDHIGTEWFLKRYSHKVDEVHQIYSRASNLSSYRFKMPKRKWFKLGSIKVLNRSIEILNWEISKTDEKLADEIITKKKIKSYKYFAPEKLTSDVYATSKEQNILLYDKGILEASRVYGKGR